jgi:DNA-3-methyladenine glycosylase
LKKLNNDFYGGNDVVQIARNLPGKILVTTFNGNLTSGRIVETEAYVGITDKASHSFGGRRTQRNEHMYNEGGISYVYICYGIHTMFNVVTNKINTPDAVLIRALEPIEGIDCMLLRTRKIQLDNTLTKGPGNLCRAMGIGKVHSGISLNSKEIFITDDGFLFNPEAIAASKRIGIDGAGIDAMLPYRFYVRGNKFVSGRPVK